MSVLMETMGDIGTAICQIYKTFGPLSIKNRNARFCQRKKLLNYLRRVCPKWVEFSKILWFYMFYILSAYICFHLHLDR